MRDSLVGYKVLELASVLAGPSVGMFLAELGAEVIKVEHFAGGGDVTRTWKLASESGEDDRPAYFSAVNWGKKSIGIDLRVPAARAIVHRLAQEVDIVIASYKPGDAEKLQVDAETLMASNPKLIYADLTAYGEGDDRVGFDAIIQAESGFAYMNGDPEGGPTKMPVALMDLLAAHQLKEGILLALLRRMKTGEGQHVQTNLLGAGLASLANQATNWLVAGHIPSRIGSAHPNIVPYGTSYATEDEKEIVLAVGNDAQFERLIQALDIDLASIDGALRSNAGRVKNREEVEQMLKLAIKKRKRDELLEKLHAAQVPAGAVHNMAEACAQPQAKDLLLESEGKRALRGIALKGFEGIQLSPPPKMAANTDSVLKSVLNLSDEEIDDLRKMKAVL